MKTVSSDGTKEVTVSGVWLIVGSARGNSSGRGFRGGTRNRAREGGEEERRKRERGRHQNSKEEATVGRRLVGSWGPDTHSVWSCGLERMRVCTSVGGCVCVKQITGK